MKDEALSPAGFLMETLPIAKPSAAVRESVEHRARRLIEITSGHNETRKSVLDWLKIEYDIDKPSMKLQDPISLDPEDLIAEVKKLRGKSRPLTAAAFKALREEDARSLAPARSLALEAKRLEGQISDLVNEAYGLTPEEVQLMWDTAPPRMPITNPCTQSRRSGCA